MTTGALAITQHPRPPEAPESAAAMEKAAAQSPNHAKPGSNPTPAAPTRGVERLRIAVVHEWLVTYAGSERVVEQILALFPHADLFVVLDVMPGDQRRFLGERTVRTSFIQRLPFVRRMYRSYLPLMPMAIEQLDLRDYDLIISSSHAVAKGVLVGPNQLHICYCHTPMRYGWDLQNGYVGPGVCGWIARAFLHYLRMWDARSANGVDIFCANSRYIARRIRACYRREAQVIHPPVDVAAFPVRHHKEDFYLAGSRLVPYKRMDVIVRAFADMPSRRLLVVGDGPERSAMEKLAHGKSNIEFVGHAPHAELVRLLQRARAFIFAAEEDFGILPVEAQACGTPVIAYGKGGARESVVDGRTGILFEEQQPGTIIKAVERFERSTGFDPEQCHLNAKRFSIERFREEFFSLVSEAWERFVRDS